MIISIQPSEISGIITAPASKSASIRAVFCALMCDGVSRLENLSDSDDVIQSLNIIKSLGAKVNIINNLTVIKSNGLLTKSNKQIVVDAGKSGLCFRILLALANIFRNMKIYAHHSLLKRNNIDSILSFTTNLNIKELSDSYCIIESDSIDYNININSSYTSQYLTGLLIVLPHLKKHILIKSNQINSKYYIDLTLDILEHFNIRISRDNNNYLISPDSIYQSANLYIEGCYSSAAFLMVAAAIAGKIRIKGLKIESKQADAQILQLNIFSYTYSSDILEIQKQNIHCFNIDITHFPDLAPALVALAFNADAKSTITGIKRLKNKESNRALALKNEFEKIGGKIIIENDKMTIYPSKLNGGIVDSHDDHRIAMALAIAALNAKDIVKINGAECVSKSYPNFFKDLKILSNQA